MKKLLLVPLALAVLLSGCAGRGDKNPEESTAAYQVAPLTLTEDESALLDLIAGTDGEYGLYACTLGEHMIGCTIEVLSWEDGAWQTLAEGGLSVVNGGELRLGIVLSGSKITVNFQDGIGGQYSYAPQVEGMDRDADSGRSWVWMDAPQELTIWERVPLYLEVYDSGDGVRSATLPDTFTNAGQLNSYDRAYAVALTVEG